ncbi:hypothetical protein EJ08DRAFT_470198 [Tothia fuscella]|uniref:Uncharacterized protein n=1 Tax=Tothia fuscella TaxID=1048955 RepID=A0A9P4NY21_9PEZI|nr:hypothetical protein EJ08DRAFT_470198 [Tothia fuscella]
MNRAVKATRLIILPLLLSFANAEGTSTTSQSATSTISCDRFQKTGFWDIDIDNRPALAPECGPPLSFHAIRDTSKLPAQICGIVASYIFCLFIVGSLLLGIGRRLRRGAETSEATLGIEMVNPNKTFELNSPVGSQRSWIKGGFSRLKVHSSAASMASSNPASPMHTVYSPKESHASFDNKVVANDQQARQAEMERLYAAVMVHEETKRASEVTRASQAPTFRSNQSVRDLDVSPVSPPKPSMEGKRKLRVQISDAPQEVIPQMVMPPPQSPTQVPKSPYRAIYPPYPSPGGYSFTSGHSPQTPMTPMTPAPQRVELPNDMYPASPPPQGRQMQLPPLHPQQEQQPPPTPRSFIRKSRHGDDTSSTSSNKSKKHSLKNLRISGPVMARPNDDDAEDRQPLSPRLYNPPPPPGLPGQWQPSHSRQESGSGPLTGRSTDSDTYASERLDEPKPLPMAQPHRRPSNLTLQLPPSGNPSPSKPTLTSAASSTNTLPLRAFQNTSELSLAPSSSANPLSPGPMKTTFLERKLNKIGAGPLTGRTPRTGVPQTPFSPYMPYTPMTPVTPGLVNRKMMKERAKATGRKVLVEEDVVKDSDDMWDNGY